MGVVVGAAFLVTTNSFASITVGAIPGSHTVTEAGAAGYAVAIAAPPGTAGVEPKLSLNYSSQSPNGLLGIGWSLGGLSAVTRCPVQHSPGVSARVSYTTADRFCLDGQRLVVTGGTYGAEGNNHYTEIDTFVRVRPEGAAGSGPASFKVWTKAGLIMEYGYTEDSRVLAQGRSEVRVWALNKVTDTTGNYYTVTYHQDAVDDEYYPTRIDYTGNASAGLSPYNRVEFLYEDRPDSTLGYGAGSRVGQTQRLTHIQTYAESALVSDYALVYETAPVTGRSRLASLTRCAGDGVCLNPTLFTWSDGETPNYANDLDSNVNRPAFPGGSLV